jgi:hypothetical protein
MGAVHGFSAGRLPRSISENDLPHVRKSVDENLRSLSTSAPAPNVSVEPSVSRRGTCDRGFVRSRWCGGRGKLWVLHGRFAICPLSPLAVAFGLVLVLACTNVASMMLFRATARQREIGIRLSLGTLHRRLIRQLLTESILLSIPAAVLGFVISRVTIDAAIRVMFATVPKDMLELVHDVPCPVDWRVIAFMVFAALASALVFGLAPAFQATRANVMSSARGEVTSDLRPVRVRNALVIAQVTVCTLLLVACGALARTTVEISAFDIGFRTNNVIAMDVVENNRRRVIVQARGPR